MNISEKHLRAYMRDTIENQPDIDATTLAEETACEFNLYENEIDFPIPERIFELSAETLDSFFEDHPDMAAIEIDHPDDY